MCIIFLTVSPSPYSDDHHVFKELNRVRTGSCLPFPFSLIPRSQGSWSTFFMHLTSGITSFFPNILQRNNSGHLPYARYSFNPFTQNNSLHSTCSCITIPIFQMRQLRQSHSLTCSKSRVVFEPRKFGFRVYLIFTLQCVPIPRHMFFQNFLCLYLKFVEVVGKTV